MSYLDELFHRIPDESTGTYVSQSFHYILFPHAILFFPVPLYPNAVRPTCHMYALPHTSPPLGVISAAKSKTCLRSLLLTSFITLVLDIFDATIIAEVQRIKKEN